MSCLIVSTDIEALRRRLGDRNAPRRVLVFGDLAAKALSSQTEALRPPDYSEAERLRLLDAYVELISNIGSFNRFSSMWLSHPISEKNDLEPNPLFRQLIEFLAFRRWWDEGGRQASLAVHAPRKSLVSNIVAFARSEGIAVETPGMIMKPPSRMRSLKRALRQIRDELTRSRKLRDYARRSRTFRKVLDTSEPVTLIRTWFDLRSRDEIQAGRDVFLGPLPGFLQREGRRLLFYGGLTDIDRLFGAIEADLRKIDAFPVLPEVALLRPLDRWAIVVMSLSVQRQICFPPDVRMQGVDVTPVLRGYLSRRYSMAAFRKNAMSLFALRRLLKMVRIREVYMPFENNSWQKLLTLTLKRFDPAIRIKAFQHAQIARNSTRLFPGEEELRQLPLPDRIFTLGAYTRDFLVNHKRYPGARAIPACALRQDRLCPSDGARPRHGRLLACLWTMRRSVEVIEFLSVANLESLGWDVRIRPHPVQPIERVERRLGRAIPSSFEISRAPFAEDLRRSDVVLYNGTTACLDALAVGLPVINLEFDDFISPDPLFEFDAFKWTARTAEELRGALDDIAALSDDEYAARRELAGSFVREYFYPVNDERLRAMTAVDDGAGSQSSPKTSSSNNGS